MKLTINKRSFLRALLVTTLCAVVVAVSYFELSHRYKFGHFVPYGLHVDVLSEDVSIGIPGQTKMYRAELSNFSFLPVRLDACEYITDAFDHGIAYPYAVQRWDSASGKWQTIIQPKGDGFCRPYPTGMSETHRVSKTLSPGMSVEIMEGEATGALEPFQKNDRARFVVFKKLANEVDWRDAVPSREFIIEDDVVRERTPVRMQD
jgi:hypothetical protein